MLSLSSSFSNEIISTLFEKMDDGSIKDANEWDFSSVDENTWHGSLLCLADIAWHSGIQGNNIASTITYSLNVLSLTTRIDVGLNIRFCKRPEASRKCGPRCSLLRTILPCTNSPTKTPRLLDSRNCNSSCLCGDVRSEYHHS